MSKRDKLRRKIRNNPKERTAMNKSLDYYLGLSYTTMIIRDRDLGVYVAWVKELPGCITQAETWGEVGIMIEDAKRLWLEVALEYDDIIPEPVIEVPVA
jgi:antitoxin HicB